jgi:Lamin Tail Domain
VRNLKIIYLALWIVISSSFCISFVQDVGIAQTPSQMAFDVGLLPTMPGTQTPSQQAFALRGNQTIAVIGTPTQQTFELRGSQSTLGTETPTQQAFALRSIQPTVESGTSAHQASPAAGSYQPVAPNVTISEVVKETDELKVMVANNMKVPANLTSWKLMLNNGTTTYEFPDFILQPNEMVAIHTQAGADTSTDLFRSNFMWNGTQDIELLNEKGFLVSEYRIVTS